MACIEDVASESGHDLKSSGDLALQVIEESSDSDDETESTQTIKTLDQVTHIPAEIVPNSRPANYGNVVVSNSQKVQLGNNTYFHGNVTIKQIIHSKPGVVNDAYVEAEDEIATNSNNVEEKPSEPSKSRFQFRLVHKLLCSAVCLAIIIGGVCANIFLLKSQNNHNDEPNTQSSNKEHVDNRDNAWCAKVKGIIIENFDLTLTIAISLWVFTLTHVVTVIYSLLTKSSSGEGNIGATSISKHVNHDDNTLADQLLIAPNHLRIVSRAEWLAQPPTGVLDKLRLPAPWVIISHSATENCYSQSKCVYRVRVIQSYHIESRDWFDIGYNFLVGGDGSAYVGRGWDYEGAHTKGYNIYSIGIAFIGTFTIDTPPQHQVDACLKLIKQGVEQGKIAKDYKIFAHRQLMSTASPGDKLFELMKGWPHFVSDLSNVDQLLPKNY